MNDIQNEFISTVSLEMRTPLTSIRGFSQTLLNSWDKLDDESKKKFVKIIEEQSNRLINLVENILTVSKMNVDKPKFKQVNVNSSIEKVVQMILQKYKEYNIVLNLNKSLPCAKLDEDKFQQVMTNLLDNACKYSKPDKDIIVTTSFSPENKISIKVIDHGIGIDPMAREKIFEKFVRLENHLTSTTQGNGLGLYITKNLVESMQGTITAYSIPNISTEFWVEFPFYNPEEALKCSQQS